MHKDLLDGPGALAKSVDGGASGSTVRCGCGCGRGCGYGCGCGCGRVGGRAVHGGRARRAVSQVRRDVGSAARLLGARAKVKAGDVDLVRHVGLRLD